MADICLYWPTLADIGWHGPTSPDIARHWPTSGDIARSAHPCPPCETTGHPWPTLAARPVDPWLFIADMGQYRPALADIGRHCGQHRPTSADIGPYWPILASVGRHRPICAPPPHPVDPSVFGRHRRIMAAATGRHRPSPYYWPTLADAGHDWPKYGCGPTAADMSRHWPTLACIGRH